MKLIRAVRTDVFTQLGDDSDGHGKDHVQAVYNLAMKFAESEDVDRNVVALAALLHDVDDYKLVGKEAAKNLTNTRTILAKYAVAPGMTQQILAIIGTMGYSRSLEGIRPVSLEGKIVSDADMCDAIGSRGILRTHAYSLSKGKPFFDKTVHLVSAESDASLYKEAKNVHSVQHFFDKLLRIPELLMTEPGRAEGERRRGIMISFLEELFNEEDTDEWSTHLSGYIRSHERENAEVRSGS